MRGRTKRIQCGCTVRVPSQFHQGTNCVFGNVRMRDANPHVSFIVEPPDSPTLPSGLFLECALVNINSRASGKIPVILRNSVTLPSKTVIGVVSAAHNVLPLNSVSQMPSECQSSWLSHFRGVETVYHRQAEFYPRGLCSWRAFFWSHHCRETPYPTARPDTFQRAVKTYPSQRWRGCKTTPQGAPWCWNNTWV